MQRGDAPSRDPHNQVHRQEYIFFWFSFTRELQSRFCGYVKDHVRTSPTPPSCQLSFWLRVVRDLFYTGNPVMERATIVLRIAPSFLRFGSFEIAKGRDRMVGLGRRAQGILD